MGRVQATYKQLKTETRKGAFDSLVEALCHRFEPDSQRELYGAELQTRRKKMESWADFSNDNCALANKAFPNLGQMGDNSLSGTITLRTCSAFESHLHCARRNPPQ